MSDVDALAFQTSATYRALANSLPLCLLIKSADGRRVFANDAYLRWHHLTWSEMSGKTDAQLFAPEIAEKYHADDEEVLRTGEALHSVEQDPRREGWIERIKCPIRDHQGDIIGVQLMFWDVTEKIEAQNSARYEQSLLQALLDNLPDSVYFKDLDSRFVRVSHAMATKFGLQGVDEVHGRTDADIFTPEHALAAREDELRIIESGLPLVDRVERETWPDREDTWCLTTKMPLRDQDGHTIGTFGISRDVTDLRRSEDALREAVRLADAANRAKSEFLANMSHEIRTPMNAMVGMADLLSSTELTEEQRDCVSVIRESSSALLRLINDILDFSKIEARRLELEAIPFSLSKVTRAALNTVRLQASGKGVTLISDIDPSLPDTFIGDSGRLRQVLINLIGNAIKFTDEGSVTVQIQPCEPLAAGAIASGGSARTTLRFRVIDTGIGIPAAQQASVLEPFTQADASTTRRFGGTGLGLSISRQLVDLMGGTLQLTSEVGIGTTFFFDLDLVATDLAPVVDEDDLEEDLGGDAPQLVPLRILVAEDGVTNQHVIAGLLKLLGHDCSIASDGRETIAKWQTEAYDVILMDMHMPVMDGLEATRAIRQHEWGTDRHIPIIALTAAAMVEDASACREAGMDDYLTKPINRRRLQRVLATYARPRVDGDGGASADSGASGSGDSSLAIAANASRQAISLNGGGSSGGGSSSSDSCDSLALPSAHAGCLDLDSARSRIPGGAAGVLRLATVFRAECQQLCDQLVMQLPEHLNDESRRNAHTLKGACGLLGAKRLQEVASEIEMVGREGRLGDRDPNTDSGATIGFRLARNLRREADAVLGALDVLLGRS